MSHPAKYHESIVGKLIELLPPQLETRRCLDPFAGTGRVHLLAVPCNLETIGVELEPEWAAMHERTYVGDATALWMWAENTFDVIVTSPCYGNRLADKDMRDSVAATYMKSLGHEASEGSACHLHWPSVKYQLLHRQAWAEATRVAKPGATFLLNIKDHYRNAPQPVTAWHLQVLGELGWAWTGAHQVEVPSMRHGANHELRFDFEWIHELRLPGLR